MTAFRREVMEFYRHHGRAFPWREDITPYRVVVSEIMLQQTGVERVREKYGPFVRALPDFGSLATAPLRDVMMAWQGLGYNRRALSLKRLSEEVIQRHAGVLPRDLRSLTSLPGIGEATAGSIMAFAFNEPVAFIETNIRRVFIHRFFAERTGVSDGELMPLIEASLDRSNPREWYYALMDYGSDLGRSTSRANPNRKSTRYRLQAPFRGSRRELRGEIIRALLAGDPMTIGCISRQTERDAEHLRPVLSAMVRDGLIAEEAGRYRIA